MKRIIFVDDETNVLQGLQRMLRPMRDEWEMAFAESGSQALQTMTEKPFEVVVSDMRMPGMNGADLLAEVKKRYPQTVRIILSGQSEQETLMASLASTHQLLSKPCEPDLLKATVARAFALRDLLADTTLKELVLQIQSLPSLPSLYVELTKELESPEPSINRVAELVSSDVGMSAKILQIANSAFFGLREHVSIPARAVNLLGLDTIRALVLSLHIFSQFDRSQVPSFSLNALWSHSLAVGEHARQIARMERQGRKLTDEAFTAGLLHDLGKLVLAANLPGEYARALSLSCGAKISQDEAEKQTFGASHAGIGAYLLGLWGFPDSVVEAVAFHHCPSRCLGKAFGTLTAVHAADVLDRELHPAENGTTDVLDMEYISSLGFGGRLDIWRENRGGSGGAQ